MYFRNRADAGRKLASKLTEYRNKNVSVVALNEGAAIIGAQIAIALHANMMLLLTKNIYLPGEIDAFASISSGNAFTYNNMFSPGQLEDLKGEYNQYIESKKLENLHELNVLVGQDGEIQPKVIRHHVVILVSDGLATGFSLDIAADFLKPIAVKKLVIATPIASVDAVDKMHLFGDQVCCLSITENYINTSHYYDDNTIPDTDSLFKMIKNISLSWKH